MSAAEQLDDDVEVVTIGPQPGRDGAKGPQQKFLETEADIAFLGGAYGGGKSFAACVLDHARWAHVRGYRGIVFRKVGGDTLLQIWDEQEKTLPYLGAIGRRTPKMRWRFPSGARIQVSDLAKLENHRGPRYAVITLEEATQFTEKEFWFLFGRLGSTCGVKPYMRATTNPQSEGWVRDLLSWWIDPETGFPIPERDGVLRWFVRRSDGELDWGSSREEVEARNPRKRAISLTFIRATLADNPILDAADPDYRAKLEALPPAERAAALEGNWNASDADGQYFQESWFHLVAAPPSRPVRTVRFWDLAATKPSKENPDPDWTKGLRIGELRLADGEIGLWIDDVAELRDGPAEVLALMKRTAQADGRDVEVGTWQDPGQAGKAQVHGIAGALAGYAVQWIRASANKVAYAKVASPIAKAGRIFVKAGQPWTKPLLRSLQKFPYGVHDDDVDSLSGAVQVLTGSTPVRSLKVRGV